MEYVNVIAASDKKKLRDKIIKELGLPKSKAKWKGAKYGDYTVNYSTQEGSFFISFKGPKKGYTDIIDEVKKIAKKEGIKTVEGGKNTVSKYKGEGVIILYNIHSRLQFHITEL